MNIINTTIQHFFSSMIHYYKPAPRDFTSSPSSDLLHISKQSWRSYLASFIRRLDPNDSHKNLLIRNQDLILNHLTLINSYRDRGIHYLSFCDPKYPYLLRQIQTPPLGIFYKGSLDVFYQPCTAIVGSRKSTKFAQYQSFYLAKNLALAGTTIVSGGAIGCDISAHKGVLQTSITPSPTIAVMAGGLDRLYPSYNLDIFRKIYQRRGLIISEKLPETPPKPADFPVRNRIISGLCTRVLIMQASIRSGALATANIALNQGRDVMVLTPNRKDHRFSGSYWLKKHGAKSFQSSAEYSLLH